MSTSDGESSSTRWVIKFAIIFGILLSFIFIIRPNNRKGNRYFDLNILLKYHVL